MRYTISKPSRNLKGEITLPTSKSISNRLLIISALCNNDFSNLKNLSDSDDTAVLLKGLEQNTETIDIGAAGTSMRFMASYRAIQEGKSVMLTGTERMQNRPIKILVDALRQLGADINYVAREGYPPIQIHGRELDKSELEIDGSVSSQYISSLLMIGPKLPNGLKLTLTNKVISLPYIKLTLSLMELFGANTSINGNVITVQPGYSKPQVTYTVEADWSGASYWFQMAAMADETDIKIYGLAKDSLQGDSALVALFDQLGVKASFIDGGVHLTKKACKLDRFEFDFVENPDLAQTFAVTLCALNIPFHFKGVESLKIKETDRIAALINELERFGYELYEPRHTELAWDGDCKSKQMEPVVETYEDHRMAMAFAPLALLGNPVDILEPKVVSKSYPKFWEHLQAMGFEIVSE